MGVGFEPPVLCSNPRTVVPIAFLLGDIRSTSLGCVAKDLPVVRHVEVRPMKAKSPGKKKSLTLKSSDCRVIDLTRPEHCFQAELGSLALSRQLNISQIRYVQPIRA